MALRRLKTLKNCVIDDHAFDRLKKCRLRDMGLLLQEEQRLQKLQCKTLEEMKFTEIHDGVESTKFSTSGMMLDEESDEDSDEDNDEEMKDALIFHSPDAKINSATPTSGFDDSMMIDETKEKLFEMKEQDESVQTVDVMNVD